ncbi:MAG: hypothetical protein AMXMBFR33_10370 [Candidatus Xenobia bacterium]
MARSFVGKSIGPYQVERKLGVGGMGAVYLASRPGEEPVALKILTGPHTDDPTFIQRFAQEAAITARLDHPNIVKLLEYGEDHEAGHYLVMRYVAGKTLREVLHEQGPMPVEQAVELAGQVGEALQYAHSQGVVHRDLKPENLLCPSPDQIILTDFGVARVSAGPVLTRTGFLPGTPEYMSPEQLSNASIGPQSDLYSLGLVFYEMLTGQSPFHSENVAETISRQAYQMPPPPSRLRSEVPRNLDMVVLRCLEKDPRHRYATAEEFVKALEGPAEGATLPHLTQVVAVSGSGGKEAARRPPWWLPVLVLMLAIVLAGVGLVQNLVVPVWMQDGVGNQPVFQAAGLATAVTMHGAEVALFESRRGEDGLLRAQRSGDRLVALLREQVPRPARIRSEKRKELWVLALPDEPPLIEITPAMATRMGVKADELAVWWLALLRDQLALRRGERPEATQEYEREHPLRKGGPVSPLFEKVYDRARHRVREGPLTTGAILEAIESLSEADRDLFRQAAREVPRAAPK